MVARALRVRVSFDAKRFGADFRAWRTRENLTLRALERMAGVSQSHMSRVELGETMARGDVMACLMTLSGLHIEDYCIIKRDNELPSS